MHPGNEQMRILFLTNFYQVQETGGEDQSCQQVVQGLKERGHTTLVLTSMHGANNVPVETEGDYRSLYLEMDLVPWRNRHIVGAMHVANFVHVETEVVYRTFHVDVDLVP